jgi:transcriptional regulator with XRE-family HTH domain
VTIAARLLRSTREAVHVSQRELARRSGVPQPSIAAVETEDHDLTVESLGRLAASLGAQVALLPSLRLTAATTAVLVRDSLRKLNTGAADATVFQLANDLAAVEPALRSALVISPAPMTGDRRYDAWIAGLVEFRLAQVGVQAPAWAHEPARVSETEWAVGNVPGLAEIVRPETPEPFARRRVLISSDDLVSI